MDIARHAILLLVALGLATAQLDIRLNQIQTLHAHNSYHQCPLPNMRALFDSAIGKAVIQALQNAGMRGLTPEALSYGHADLLTLVKDKGVRSLELDIFFDADGGRYAYRAGPKLARALGVWPDRQAVAGGAGLFTPGAKVLHIPDLDFQSSCDTLSSCLAPIAQWSRDNPGHTPLFIGLEIKTWDPYRYLSDLQDRVVNNLLKVISGEPDSLATSPAPDVGHLARAQLEILSVFNLTTQVFTPDMFRTIFANHQERITYAGWPTLDQAKGRVFFKVLGPSEWLDLLRVHWPMGSGSIFFLEADVDSIPYTPANDTIFASVNWPRRDAAWVWNQTLLAQAGIASLRGQDVVLGEPQRRLIADLYRQGLRRLVSEGRVMVRAPADVETIVARQNYNGYASAAMAGGAHFIHTDYPNGEISKCDFTSPYTVRLAQTWAGSWNPATSASINTTRWANATSSLSLASVCNPVTATLTCTWWAAGQQPKCKCYSLV